MLKTILVPHNEAHEHNADEIEDANEHIIEAHVSAHSSSRATWREEHNDEHLYNIILKCSNTKFNPIYS